MTSGMSSKLIGITAAAALTLTAPDVQAQDAPSTNNPSRDASQPQTSEHVETAPQDSLHGSDLRRFTDQAVEPVFAAQDDQPLTASTQYHVEADLNGKLNGGLRNELMRTSITTNYSGLGDNDLQGSFTVLNDYQITSDDNDNVPAEQKIGAVIGSVAPQDNDDGWTGSNLVVFNSGNPFDAPYIESSTTAQFSDETTRFTPTFQAGVNGESFDNGVPQETYAIVNTTLDQELNTSKNDDTSLSLGGLIGRWGSNLAKDAQTFLNAEASVDISTRHKNAADETELYTGAFSNAGTDGGVISYRSETTQNGVGHETGITVFGQQEPDGTVYGKAKLAFGDDSDPDDAAEGVSPTSYGTGASAITSTLTRPQLFPPKIPHTVQNGDYTAEAELRTNPDENTVEADLVVGHQRSIGDVTVGAAAGPSYKFKDNDVDPGVEGVLNVDYQTNPVTLGLETQIERDGDIQPYLKFTYTP